MYIDVPEDCDTPVTAPGMLLDLVRESDGLEGKVRVTKIEGRRIYFENVSVH